MRALLCGQWAAAEQASWQFALQAALPEVTWLTLDAPSPELQATELAVVANPVPGSLQGLPKLRFIQSLWAGVDRLLGDHTVPHHVPLARMVEPAMTAAMVEAALWATLSLHRGFFTYARQQARSEWQHLPQLSAVDVNVLVLGFGEMGRSVAHALATRGYAVQAWRRTAGDALDVVAHAAADTDRGAAHEASVRVQGGAQALWQLLPQAHIVINLLPLHDSTRGLLDARFFAALPRGASVVNFGRGPHVVDEALLAALDSGHLTHAVLDVFHLEPLPSAHRFWRHERVTMLPHAAALTDFRSATAVAVGNVRAFMRGGELRHLVDRGAGY